MDVLLQGSLVVDENVELPVPLTEDVHLDRATDEEVNGWCTSHPSGRPGIFNYNILPIDESHRPIGFQGNGLRYHGLEPQAGVSRWVVVRGTKGPQDSIEIALRLVSPDLGVAGRVQTSARPEIMAQFQRIATDTGTEQASAWLEKMDELGRTYFPWYSWSTQSPWYPAGTTTKITNEWIGDLRETIGLVDDLDSDRFPHLARALEIYLDTDKLGPTHALFTMGRFASIESLLVHSPAPGDLVDSISNQVVRSVLLLSNRMKRPIDFESFVGNTDPAKAIKKAYAFRSLIAHGGARLHAHEAFSKSNHNELAVFGTPLGASVFCHEITRSVIQQALREPQLAHDLKG